MKRSISSIDEISTLIRENSIKSAGLSTLKFGKKWAFDVILKLFYFLYFRTCFIWLKKKI